MARKETQSQVRTSIVEIDGQTVEIDELRELLALRRKLNEDKKRAQEIDCAKEAYRVVYETLTNEPRRKYEVSSSPFDPAGLREIAVALDKLVAIAETLAELGASEYVRPVKVHISINDVPQGADKKPGDAGRVRSSGAAMSEFDRWLAEYVKDQPDSVLLCTPGQLAQKALEFYKGPKVSDSYREQWLSKHVGDADILKEHHLSVSATGNKPHITYRLVYLSPEFIPPSTI